MSGGGRPAIDVRMAGPDEVEVWIEVLTRGFATPDESPTATVHETFDDSAIKQVFRDMARDHTFHRVLAFRNDELAGGAGLRMDEGIAQFAGAATLPQHRKHGVQTTLLHRRLEMARAASCEYATITTDPGTRSQKNSMRAGFDLVYARSVLVKG